MADERLRVVKGSYGPSADAFLNGKYQNPNPNDTTRDEWSDDWSAGLQVTYTLFDGLERKGRLTQAKSVRRQAEANLRNAEEAARVEIHQALLDLRNAEELYQSQAKNIDLSREALRMLENGHKVGKNTQIEVLDARSALTEAMGQYYNAIYSHVLARLAIRKAIGTLAVDASETVDPSIHLDSDPL
jgi:outer membrane protein TolC